MSLGDRLERSPLGGLLIGIALIVLAPVVATILGTIDPNLFVITIQTQDAAGNTVTQTIDFTILFTLIKAFVPLLMIIAGIYKLAFKSILEIRKTVAGTLYILLGFQIYSRDSQLASRARTTSSATTIFQIYSRDSYPTLLY